MMTSGKIVEHNINYSSTNIEENDRKFLSNIALRVHNSGLVIPAVFFLEMTKPISSLGGHLLVFLGPVLNSFIQSENYYRRIEVFENRENVELLIKMIEDLENNER